MIPSTDNTATPTFLDQFNAANRRPAGFDYMRIALAVSIIAFHSVIISYGPAAQQHFLENRLAGTWAYLLVPMFFALSGFLVAGSLERTKSIVSFLGLRILRIVPALGAEIFLSALVLGPVFTALPFGDYVRTQGFHVYFLNVVGDIHYFLPGVFAGNPSHKVNGQLWTIPGEFTCYMTLAILFMSSFVKRRPRLLFATLAAQILLPLGALEISFLRDGILGIPNWLLVLLFLTGVSMFRYRERIPWRWEFAVASFIAYTIMVGMPFGFYFIPLPVAYLTIYLGLLNPPRVRLIESGDYSYGLYLYGYPIQQAVAALSPATQAWWINIAVALPLAFGFAAVSWHVLEKRVLQRKPAVIATESWVLALLGRFRAEPLAPEAQES